MAQVRKITVDVPEELLRRAQKATGEGITATIRSGLKLVAARDAYAALRALRGRVQFSVDWRELRKDR
jgi:hypothetical protein